MQKESLRNCYINPQRHNVFVSFHHADEYYRDMFEGLFADGRNNIFISKSVQLGDIDTDLKTETIRRKIREEHLHDTTVTIVLIGTHTWQRKYVDWEIASSIYDTENNTRSGLLGIFLPDYPLTTNRFEPHYPIAHPTPLSVNRLDLGYPITSEVFNPYTIPPRLYDNWKCGFAKLYRWNLDPQLVWSWIEDAFQNRNRYEPDNSRNGFKYNKSGDSWQ